MKTRWSEYIHQKFIINITRNAWWWIIPFVKDCDSHDDVIKWKHFPHYWSICAGNSPVPGEFPAQRPVTRSFDVFFDLRLNKRLSKQSWGWWFETLPCSSWRHCNEHGIFLSILHRQCVSWDRRYNRLYNTCRSVAISGMTSIHLYRLPLSR